MNRKRIKLSLLLLLIALALIKRFPYHLFTKTHKWLAAIFAVLVYHTVVLTKIDYWSQPVGWVLALLLLGGTWAAVLALSGRIGAQRRTPGKIESLIYYPELRVLEISLLLEEGWTGHEAGQFAFVTSNPREGAHPYTIASAWNPQDRRVVFITKALGDHTSRLHNKLQVGALATVEGPYGCFDFRDQRPRQIWIGAGIGITPFVARMKQLAQTPGTQEIDLFHPTADFEPDAIEKLMAGWMRNEFVRPYRRGSRPVFGSVAPLALDRPCATTLLRTDLRTPRFIRNYFRCAESPITPQTKVDPFFTSVPHD